MPSSPTTARTTVSIPFKRESPFGHVGSRKTERESQSVSIPFKRESPFGHGKQKRSLLVCEVSIPFKRESPFGRMKTYGRRGPGCHRVSIPFKRESPFGQRVRTLAGVGYTIVSIPFKRESPFGLPPISAVGSYTPKPNANCAGLFLRKNFTQNPDKPL